MWMQIGSCLVLMMKHTLEQGKHVDSLPRVMYLLVSLNSSSRTVLQRSGFLVNNDFAQAATSQSIKAIVCNNCQ